MSAKFKHHKIKNTGILFELLSRQITADLLNENNNPFSVKLLKKYFNKTTQLGKELRLYNILVKESCASEAKSNYLLEGVLKSRQKLSNKTLRSEKYNLIKEIKDNYPITDFFKSKIKHYKTYASIYQLFENIHTDPKDCLDIRYAIIEHLQKDGKKVTKKVKSSKLVEQYKKQNEDVRLLSYRILVDNFNSKYKNLNAPQKKLLREYINNISNTNKIKEYVDSEVNRLNKQLKNYSKKISDKVTKIKLNEATKQMNEKFTSPVMKDDHFLSLMRYYELAKEIKKCLRKD
jgi:hypothetical protein